MDILPKALADLNVVATRALEYQMNGQATILVISPLVSNIKVQIRDIESIVYSGHSAGGHRYQWVNCQKFASVTSKLCFRVLRKSRRPLGKSWLIRVHRYIYLCAVVVDVSISLIDSVLWELPQEKVLWKQRLPRTSPSDGDLFAVGEDFFFAWLRSGVTH